MTEAAKSSAAPLVRRVSVGDLPGRGLEITVEPTPAEREALARDFGLVSVDSLKGTFKLVRKGRLVRVTGEVKGTVQQTCVVTMEAFPAEVQEPVDVRYAEEVFEPGEEVELTQADLDAPEPIVAGGIDVGALTAEFLALGLDPYPRKPGVSFDFEAPGHEDASPFAALAALKDPGK